MPMAVSNRPIFLYMTKTERWYLAAENTELVAELQKRGWNFMDAVILECPEIIPTLERMGADLEQSRYATYLSK